MREHPRSQHEVEGPGSPSSITKCEWSVRASCSLPRPSVYQGAFLYGPPSDAWLRPHWSSAPSLVAGEAPSPVTGPALWGLAHDAQHHTPNKVKGCPELKGSNPSPRTSSLLVPHPLYGCMSTIFRGKGPRENFSAYQPSDPKSDPNHDHSHALTQAMPMIVTPNHDGDSDPNHDAPLFTVGQTPQEPTVHPTPLDCGTGHPVVAPGLATARQNPASMPRGRVQAYVAFTTGDKRITVP